ncbi:probable long-chain-alcohol O-fatty-acyltransferase 4 [Asparagus officinalis]|uniref:probable long-chain-alcohol O-fatty-acyltransferase 4 n=1 Tax=Asparagus officinalis TaxID=4686 RepID=UPI00098E2638|nr:probable long-chain-alcohol O-fatty-acyltransferase 4 [Asparagus officinalis]
MLKQTSKKANKLALSNYLCTVSAKRDRLIRTKKTTKMAAEGEMMALIKVTAWVVASMTYARFASSATKPGLLRLLFLLPAILLLPFLPWSFTSSLLRGTSAFFLVWLGIFKLFLLSFGVGSLSPSLPLPTFIAISSLPVKIQTAHKSNTNLSSITKLCIPYCIKLASLSVLIHIDHYKSQIHPWATLSVYSLCIYLYLDLVLAVFKFLVATLLGLATEPQFKNPFGSDSLQDFWGRRWNLMVTSILRPSVYYPVRSRLGTDAGLMAAFLVSGLMHEIMFYYMTVERPSGEVSLFFVAQGLFTLAEVKAKKAGRWRLMHPPLLRGGADDKCLKELAEMLRLVEDGGPAVMWRLIGRQTN